MQLLTELLDLNEREGYFLTENLNHLKELGLGRMVNAFKQSFSQSGHGNTSRLTKTNVGSKLQSRATGIGPGSESIEVGPVRNWPRVKRELIKQADIGIAGLLFRVDEKPVSLVVMGTGWTINNTRVVLGQAWDFTNVSAADAAVEMVLEPLHAVKASDDPSKPKKVKVREYQGRAVDMDQLISFIKAGVEAFGNRFHFNIITREPEKKEAEKKKAA